MAGATAGQLLRSLRQKASQWWYFLDHPEVPPDNNQAERSLRLAVTKRKVSGGSRSMERFQHTANLLTVVQTCRRQGRAVIDFFARVGGLFGVALLDFRHSTSLIPRKAIALIFTTMSDRFPVAFLSSLVFMKGDRIRS